MTVKRSHWLGFPTQVSEKCYYINCPAKIGVYVADVKKGLLDGSFFIFRQFMFFSFLKCSILIKSFNTHKTVSFYPDNLHGK